jgi:hypothetical protein
MIELEPDARLAFHRCRYPDMADRPDIDDVAPPILEERQYVAFETQAMGWVTIGAGDHFHL